MSDCCAGNNKDDGVFDLAIIGSGSGAFAAALRAQALGAKTVMIEASTIGGTCVNVGCVPSKAMIAVANHVHQAANSPFSGVAAATLSLDPKAIAVERAALVAELRGAKYQDVLSTLPNVTLLNGWASFQADGSLKVGDQSIRANKILIAAGAAPKKPKHVGLEGLPYWTSTEALAADHVPESLVVWGAGYVGLELAQAFSRLGSKVTVLARSRLLSKMDSEISQGLQEILEAEGIEVILKADFKSVRYSENRFVIDGIFGKKRQLETERLLVATGRRANTIELGLEHVGVDTNTAGEIVVNEQLQTSNPAIYAVGDVSTLPKFVYVAAYTGKLAAENALGREQQQIDLTIVPEVTFTEPQVAAVGLSERAAKAKGIEVVTSIMPMAYVPRAIVTHRTDGFVKLIADKATDRLLGAQILADSAGEIVLPVAFALKAGMRVSDITSLLHPYLTWGEALKLTAQGFTTDVTKLSCCAA